MLDLIVLLADGVPAAAPATSWLSPEGITAIIFGVTTLLGVVTTILERLGKHEAARKLAVVQAAGEKGAVALGGLVSTIADARRSGLLRDPVATQALLAKIKSTTHELGVAQLLDSVVQAEKVGETEEERRRLALETAKAVIAPPPPPPAPLLRRITGRL